MKQIRLLVILLATVSLSLGLVSDNAALNLDDSAQAKHDQVTLATFALPIPSPAPCQTLSWCRHTTKLKGRVSTYGGPNDSGDNNIPALPGATNRSPGIAVYNRHTLGGYWLITYVKRITHVVRQTDYGPAPWTRRKFDFNPPASKRFGGIVTDRLARGVYLGKRRARALLRARTIQTA